MLDPRLATVLKEKITDWRRNAEARRRVTPVDQVADTIEFCAADLERELAEAEQSTAPLSPEQYAALPHVGVSAKTVRAWIARKELVAVRTARGWEIPRNARRQARRLPRGRAGAGAPVAVGRAARAGA